MTNRTVETLIRTLDLQPHPEGGYFKETYRSEDELDEGFLPARFSGKRACCTAIYYLLSRGDFSAFHRIKSDEIWHFYAGDPLVVHMIDPDGKLGSHQLGADPGQGETFQAMVPAGSWFAAGLAQDASYALVGCTVSPGFDFSDFEMADRSDLLERYPMHREIITKYTRINGG